MTFDAKNCKVLLQFQDLIPNFIEVAKLAVKEKVVRLVVSCFANFLKLAKEQAIPQFVGSKVASFVETLESRTYSDQEFRDDISSLAEELHNEIQKLRYLVIFSDYLNFVALSTSMLPKSSLVNLTGVHRISLNCSGSTMQLNLKQMIKKY